MESALPAWQDENAMHLLENPKCNDTTYAELPDDMRFNDGHMVTIFTYSILMMISAAGNITVLITTIIRKRKSKSRIHTLVMHLSIADLFVRTCEHLTDHTNTICEILTGEVAKTRQLLSNPISIYKNFVKALL